MACIPGLWKKTLELDGISREVEAFIPKRACEERLPLAFWLHCYGCMATFETDATLLKSSEDFILVLPHGVGKSWNTPDCCGAAQKKDLSDLCFLQLALLELQTSLVLINLSYVYLTGYSNGGYLASYATLQNLNWIRGFVSFSGHVYQIPQKLPGKSVRRVFIHHGEIDRCVNTNGCCETSQCHCIQNPSTDVCVSTNDIFSFWLKQNGCQNTKTSFEDSSVKCLTGTDCLANTTFCSYSKGSHAVWHSMTGDADAARNWITDFIFEDFKTNTSRSQVALVDLVDRSICPKEVWPYHDELLKKAHGKTPETHQLSAAEVPSSGHPSSEKEQSSGFLFWAGFALLLLLFYAFYRRLKNHFRHVNHEKLNTEDVDEFGLDTFKQDNQIETTKNGGFKHTQAGEVQPF